MPQQLEFLGWDRPLVELAVEKLWARREALPRLAVVAPTAQSGRLLREALAERGGCLAPRVMTPEAFFRAEEAAGIATLLEERHAWITELRQAPAELMQALFPIEPSERSFAWAAGAADELLAAWDALAEGGRSFEDARRESPEPERWQDIARLHQQVVRRLTRRGLIPRAVAKARTAVAATLPEGVLELLIIGVPDPAPLAVTVWEKLTAPVTVWVNAPLDWAEAFDESGRPLAEFWTGQPVALAQDRIHLVAGAAELGAKVVELCAGRRSDEVTAGLCDAAFGPALEAAFGEAGWKAWNPEGTAAGKPMANLLRGLAALGRGEEAPGWAETAALLRDPLLGSFLKEKGLFGALKRLDAIEADNLPGGLERLEEILWNAEGSAPERLVEMVEWLSQWKTSFADDGAAATLAAWVREMREGGVNDGAEGGLYRLLEDATPHLAKLEEDDGFEDVTEAVELALTGMAGLRTAEGREESVLDLPGWLELSYQRAPLLVLAGMHDGAVPDGAMDDAFLPDGVRVRLELRHMRSRQARDAYLLRALCESRRVEAVVAKADPEGEPRRPSRLLLAAKGRELAERVRYLAGPAPAGSSRLPAWGRGKWLLEFPGDPKIYLDGERKLSPSALRDYLYCPFRFYLRRVLKWDRYEADKLEMNPRDFGNLCHFALEAMGRDEAMRQTTDLRELSDFLIERVDFILRQRYGPSLSLPLMVQREAAVARLERFADLEIKDRQEGWSIVDVEIPVGREDYPWSFYGQPVSMQIDRIDRHPRLGMRVLDYKSAAKADTPDKAHLRTASDRRRAHGAYLPATRGEKEWKNVQLPLYAAYVQERYELPAPPMIGYVNLPATLNDVAVQMWNAFDGATQANALEWTRGAIDSLRAGVHWPPVELTASEQRLDDYAALASDGLAAAVSGPLIEKLRAAQEAYDAERGALR